MCRRQRPSAKGQEAAVAVTLTHPLAMFGVYDGHAGVRCAWHLRDHLHQGIRDSTDFHKNRIEQALRAYPS